MTITPSPSSATLTQSGSSPGANPSSAAGRRRRTIRSETTEVPACLSKVSDGSRTMASSSALRAIDSLVEPDFLSSV